MDNTGRGCGVPGSMEKRGVPESVEDTGSVVFVTTAYDQKKSPLSSSEFS